MSLGAGGGKEELEACELRKTSCRPEMTKMVIWRSVGEM